MPPRWGRKAHFQSDRLAAGRDRQGVPFRQGFCPTYRHGHPSRRDQEIGADEFDNPMSRASSRDPGRRRRVDLRQNHPRRQLCLPRSHQGQAIRFLETQVRPMGRQARGVRAMHLPKATTSSAWRWSRKTASSFHRRKWLWQTHPAPKLPADRARRQGRHQHEDHPQTARWSASFQ